MKARLLAFALACAPLSAFAQDPAEAEQRAKEIETYCAKAYCRPARTVRLTREDGTTFEKDVPRLPIVLPNGWITLFAGEEIYIELVVANGVIKSWRAVPKPRRGIATLTFRLAQQPGKPDTELTVSHGLPQYLKFSLGQMLLTGGDVQATSSCPVQPGTVNHEHWQYPVFQAVISNVRLLPEGAALSCGR